MRKELFTPYMSLIKELIKKAFTADEIQIIRDMIDHFNDRFHLVIGINERDIATTELWRLADEKAATIK